MFPCDQIINYLPIQTAVERTILETLGQIQLQLQNLTARQQDLEKLLSGRRLELPSEDLEDDTDLPLMSIEDLDRLEEKLKDKNTRNILVITLVHILKDTILFCTYLGLKNVSFERESRLKHNTP